MESERRISVSADEWDWPLQHNDETVHVTNTADRFEVGLDASLFSPKDIEVKVIGNNLLVECRQSRLADQYGSIQREVRRTYQLPADVDTSSIRSSFNQRGVLQITAKKRAGR
uniref:SHSP domain-containing protein n=1 Tax=Acrobeloides nanus TaxID=290746 RepID=A0A914DFB3_9BILA